MRSRRKKNMKQTPRNKWRPVDLLHCFHLPLRKLCFFLFSQSRLALSSGCHASIDSQVVALVSTNKTGQTTAMMA